MQEYETQEYHKRKAEELHSAYLEGFYDFDTVDKRLTDYVENVVFKPEDHNLYEILAVSKFLRLWNIYKFDVDWVKSTIALEHALEFKTDSGPQKITLSPCQVFQFASIYGFVHKVQVEKMVPVRDEDGHTKMERQFYEEERRLVTHFIIMIPRKYGKTSQMVFFAIDDFMFGDDDSEVYCCSNSDKQAKILFNFIKFSLKRLDKNKKYFRTTLTEATWKEAASKKTGKTSLINSLSGGAETKDGLKCSLHLQDEYGAAKYVNGHSDAAALYQVVTSSMGTRKQPLSGIITTAGRVVDGPFQPMLEIAKQVLRGELEADWQFAHIFQPDGWEMGDEYMGDEHLWRKVQPHYGYTVQSTYYQSKYEATKTDHEEYIEFNTKLLNKFQSDNVLEWVDANDIRNLQIKQKVDDFSPKDGWLCFIGMDFSKGDDLTGCAYYLWNPNTREHFVDVDAWITEETLDKHPNRPLYELWVKQGWLRVSPGRVIDENLVLQRLMEVERHVNIVKIGFDAYDAKRFVQCLGEWIRTAGGDPSRILCSVKQTFAEFTRAVQQFEYLYKSNPAKIHFCENPLLPWTFGNCYLAESNDGNENKKPIKKSRNQKIDLAICVLEGILQLEQFGIDRM